MAVNNPELSSVRFGTLTIPLSGDGVFCEITEDPDYEEAKSMSKVPVYNRSVDQGGTIVINAFPHDLAAGVLRQIKIRDLASKGIFNLPGAASDLSSGHLATWAGGRMTQAPGMRIVKNSQVYSATFRVYGLEILKPFPALG